VVQLKKKDLSVVCRAEFPVLSNQPAAGYYQAPVVDSEGNGYVTLRTLSNKMRASVVKISPDCATKILLNTSQKQVSTPTLADNQYILVAANEYRY
jgi:hypothetical protein